MDRCERTEAECSAVSNERCERVPEAVCLRYRLISNHEEGLHCSSSQAGCERVRRFLPGDRQMIENCTARR
ncbi:MAG: hypothetical protein Tsb0020_05520 [Haliangiales bacterium]